jgi:hypothetical protein
MRPLLFAPFFFLIVAVDASHAQMQLPGAVSVSTPKGQSIAPPRFSAPRANEDEYGSHFTAAKPPEIEGVLGKPLRLLGVRGALQVEKSGDGFVVTRFVAEGDKISHPNEPCEVSMGADGPIGLRTLGSADGLNRLELISSACPLQFDVLNGALRARSPVGACSFAQADCRIDASGLWGPPGGSFSEVQIKSLEKDRGTIEQAIRGHFRALLHKLKNDMSASESVVKAQAAFPAERAQACRDYDREEVVGFCALRLTEARDFLLQSQLAAEHGLRKSEKGREHSTRVAKPHRLRPSASPQ